MGKKYLGKTMLLIALSTTLLGASLPAQAAEILPNELVMVQPREIGIVKMNCQLTISSNGNASCLGDVSMKAGYDFGNYPCPSEEHKRENLVQCCQLDGQRQ